MNDRTKKNIATLILRITLGVIFLTHGLPKLLGGVEGTAQFLGQLGVPLAGLTAWGLTVLEIGGGALILAGSLVPQVAALLAVHMLMGIVLVHGANGWYVVGPGQGGAEFNLLLTAGLAALILLGPGSPALRPKLRTG